jgi:hypothetical protein
VALNQIGGFWARAELPFRPVDMAFAPGNAGPSESDSDAAEGGRAVDQGARRPSQGPLAPEVGNRNFIASSGDDVVGMRSSGIHREDIPEHSRTTRVHRVPGRASPPAPATLRILRTMRRRKLLRVVEIAEILGVSKQRAD